VDKEPQPVTAGFSVSLEELLESVKGFDRLDQEAVKKDPAGFLNLIKDIMSEDRSLFPLADKQHSLGEGFVPADLTALSELDLTVNRAGMQLRKEAALALEAMSRAAEKDGVTLDISSAYRSYVNQDYLYQASIAKIGQEATDRELAKPGTSQHQLGTTIDFGSVDESFVKTKAYAWLAKNAGSFGFSMSYPAGDEAFTGYIHESWHYRYITKAGVDFCSRYFGGSQHAMMKFLDARWPRFMIWRAKS
jgi:D-alanyl-D-alanine carboxypeptidase